MHTLCGPWKDHRMPNVTRFGCHHCSLWRQPNLVTLGILWSFHWSNVDSIHMITRCDHNVYGANIRHLWDIKFPSFQKCLTKIFAQKLFPSPCCNCLSEPLHSGLCTILTFHPLEPTAAECNYLMQTDILFSSIKKIIDLFIVYWPVANLKWSVSDNPELIEMRGMWREGKKKKKVL